MNYNERQAAMNKRNARIRHQMLKAVYGSRTNRHGGWITGRGVLDALDWCGPDIRPDNDDHATGLLSDLVLGGYLEAEDNREFDSQPYTLDYVTYRATARGSGFINLTEPPTGLIDDGRILKT